MPKKPEELRRAIYEAWLDSGGEISHIALARKFHVEERTVKRAILDGEYGGQLRQQKKIIDEGKPDLDNLKKRAWMNIIQQVYKGDFAVSKWVVGLHDINFNVGTTNQMPEEVTQSAEAFGGQ